MHMIKKSSSVRGFTLVELLVAMAITGILMVAIYSLYTTFYKQTADQDLLIEAQQSARAAIEILERDLVMTGYAVPSTVQAIQSANANSIEFRYVDPVETSQTLGVRLKIKYGTVDAEGATHIYRTICEEDDSLNCTNATATAPYKVISYLKDATSGLVFEYYDKDGAQISSSPDVAALDLPKIQFIKVSVTTVTKTVLPTTKERKSVKVHTEIRLRNIGLGVAAASTNVPAAPTGLKVRERTIGERIGVCGKLRLRWDKGTESDLAGYYIYYSVGGSQLVARVSLGQLESDASYYYFNLEPTGANQLVNNTTYSFTIKAYNRTGGVSNASAAVSGDPNPSRAVFDDGENDTTITVSKSAPPAGFIAASGADGEVVLNWDQYDTANNPDVIGYRIYRSTARFTSFPIVPDGNTIVWIAGAPNDGLPADKTIATGVRTFTDRNLGGCQTYYYAIAPVNCDTNLFASYAAADYAATCGDGSTTACSPGTGFASVANSDTTPTDITPPPAPEVNPTAGWKAVFLDIISPTMAGTPDFDHTTVYFNEGGGCPSVDVNPASATYGVISNGFAVPNSDSAAVRGKFITPGTVPPVTHLDDDCINTGCTDKPLNGTTRNLENASTYCYLGVAYDHCGNPKPIANAITTLTELCGDDPGGPPGNGSKGVTWPTDTTPISVAGCQASDGLDVSWQSMNHTYPSGYYDGAFYKVHMKTGDGDFTGINPSSTLTLKANKQAQLSTPMTMSSGPIVSGISDGQSYYFGITATDCVYENDTATFPLNFSGWRIIGPISPGQIGRDEMCSGGGACDKDLHREVLTGVSLDAGNVSTPVTSPTAAAYKHNTVTMFFDNSSAGNMTIQRATVYWLNSSALLTGVTVGGGRSGLSMTTTSLSGTSGMDNDITDATIPGLKRYVPITFEFKDGGGNAIDMRGDQLRITLNVKNESTGSTTCLSYLTTSAPQILGDIVVPDGPSVLSVTQDQPTNPTSGYAVPGMEMISTVPSGSYGPVVIGAGMTVSIYATAVSNTADATGAKIPFRAAKLYYRETENTVTTAPASGYTEADMWLNQWEGNGYAYGNIPAKDGMRVWYYIVMEDQDGNFDREPETEYGAFTYDQKPPDPCEVAPYMNSQWNMLDPWSTNADAASNTVNLMWHTTDCYEPDCSVYQYPVDTFYYRVYRRDSFTGSFNPISAGDCSGIISCPQGWYNSCGCTDSGTSGLDVSNNDNSYYIRAVNSCDPANDRNLSSDTSNIYSECKGVGGGRSLQVDKTSMRVWESLQITIDDCPSAADGGWDDIINNLNITSASGRDVDIVSAYEDDAGQYHVQVRAMPSTTDCDSWDWYTGSWAGGYLCVDSSDTITVSLEGASGSPKTIAVSPNPCWETPEPPSELRLEIADSNATVRSNSSSIHVKFTAPQVNTDGSQLADLDHYVLTVTRGGSVIGTINVPLTACTSSSGNPAEGTTCDYTYNAGSGVKMKDYTWSFTVKAVDSCSQVSETAGPKAETCTGMTDATCPRYY